MSVAPTTQRLLNALAISVLLHAAALSPTLLGRRGDAPPVLPSALQARLLPPPVDAPEEALLKNTLAAAETATPQPATQAPRHPSHSSRDAIKAAQKRQSAAQRKLAAHLFYPPAASAAGLEGEVRLLLMLAPDGTILDAQIASGSGHAILDQAALAAAHATRRLPGAGVKELILPVIFGLQ